MNRVFTARAHGTCTLAGDPIRPGERIMRDFNTIDPLDQWMHHECWLSRQRTKRAVRRAMSRARRS